MKLFSFRKLNWVDFIIIGQPLLNCISLNYLKQRIAPLQKNGFLEIIITAFCCIIASSPQIVMNIYYSSKRKPTLPDDCSNSRRYFLLISQTHEHSKKFWSFFLVFLMIALTILFNCLSPYIIQSKVNSPFEIITFIGCLIGFSMLILKTKLYLHHYISLSIFTLGNLLMSLQTFLVFDLLTNAFILGFGIFIAVISAYMKMVMEKKYLQPLEFTFGYGVFGMIILWTIYGFGFWFDVNTTNEYIGSVMAIPKDFMELFNDGYTIILTCLWVVIGIVLAPMFMILIYYENPISEDIASSFMNFFYLIYLLWFVDYRNVYTWMLIIGGVMLLIGFLIYFEFIILHWWGMNNNTREEIEKRGYKETEVYELDTSYI